MCDRYVHEIVLAFGLCPWAEPALRSGRVARAVCLSRAPAPIDCLPFIDQFAEAEAPAADIGLLVFPHHTGGWVAFDTFAERVRRVDAQRRAGAPGAGAGHFLVAAFHPDGAQTFAGRHQMVSFVRRTPDPMLQFVRAEILDHVKTGQPDASDAVARRNFDALAGEGARRLDAVAHAIRLDRDATYARLAVASSVIDGAIAGRSWSE